MNAGRAQRGSRGLAAASAATTGGFADGGSAAEESATDESAADGWVADGSAVGAASRVRSVVVMGTTFACRGEQTLCIDCDHPVNVAARYLGPSAVSQVSAAAQHHDRAADQSLGHDLAAPQSQTADLIRTRRVLACWLRPRRVRPSQVFTPWVLAPCAGCSSVRVASRHRACAAPASLARHQAPGAGLPRRSPSSHRRLSRADRARQTAVTSG